MTTVEAIRARLLAAPAVAALVGQRVYPSKMPQAPTFPTVVLQVISDVPVDSLAVAYDGRLSIARLQVDCYAPTYLQAHQVADAVDQVVSELTEVGLSAVKETSQDLYDDEVERHRVSMDFAVMRGPA